MNKFYKWIKENKKTIADVARDFGVKHGVVRRWALGLAIPQARFMQRIVAYTNGEVQPNDFYEVAQNSSY